MVLDGLKSAFFGFKVELKLFYNGVFLSEYFKTDLIPVSFHQYQFFK